jgi:hypothetical protein
MTTIASDITYEAIDTFHTSTRETDGSIDQYVSDNMVLKPVALICDNASEELPVTKRGNKNPSHPIYSLHLNVHQLDENRHLLEEPVASVIITVVRGKDTADLRIIDSNGANAANADEIFQLDVPQKGLLYEAVARALRLRLKAFEPGYEAATAKPPARPPTITERLIMALNKDAANYR